MTLSIPTLIEQLTLEQLALFEEDQPWLKRFVVKTDTILLAIEPSTEDPNTKGLMYFFDDNLGGYTIKGIKNSLGGKVYYL